MLYRVLSGGGVGLQRLRHFVLSRGTLETGCAARNGRRLLRDRDWRGAPSPRRQPRLHRRLQRHSRGLPRNRLPRAGQRECRHCNDLRVGVFSYFYQFTYYILHWFCTFPVWHKAHALFFSVYILHPTLVMHFFFNTA